LSSGLLCSALDGFRLRPIEWSIAAIDDLAQVAGRNPSGAILLKCLEDCLFGEKPYSSSSSMLALAANDKDFQFQAGIEGQKISVRFQVPADERCSSQHPVRLELSITPEKESSTPPEKIVQVRIEAGLETRTYLPTDSRSRVLAQISKRYHEALRFYLGEQMSWADSPLKGWPSG
jgi:hypothetical protein